MKSSHFEKANKIIRFFIRLLYNKLFAQKSDHFIAALYKKFLFREPDFIGLLEKTTRVHKERNGFIDVIEEILSSQEFESCLPQFLSSLKIKIPFTNNQSQFNEIEVLISHVLSSYFNNNVIVDVGARGKERSNSWDLLNYFGWNGLLIEANPNLKQKIENDFNGLNFVLINCAVSDYNGKAKFTIGINDDVSSLNQDFAKNWGCVKGDVEVNVRRLHEILHEEKIPVDFAVLSLDIEGEDLKVLNDLINNSEYKPKYIILEASYDFNVKSLEDLELSQKVKDLYKIVAQTRANLLLWKM